jgi:ribokinase
MLLVSGSLNYDITFEVNAFAPPKAIIKKISRYFGGSGGNAAVAAARILGPRKVFFLGSVGNDEIGKMHLKSLAEEGVITQYITVVEGVESGQAYVAVRSDGETAIYSYYGANQYIEGSRLPEILPEVQATLIMNPPLEVAREIALQAKASGKKVFWDPGALAYKGVEELAEIIRHTDYFMPNLNELLILTKEKSITNALNRIKEINPDMRVLLKKGSEGASLHYLSSGEELKVPAIPPHSLGLGGIVATVGCGDALSGTFTALILRGFSERDSLLLSVCAASVNLAFEGPRNSPTYIELLSKYSSLRKSYVEKHAEF